jgi:hypothetical protein
MIFRRKPKVKVKPWVKAGYADTFHGYVEWVEGRPIGWYADK